MNVQPFSIGYSPCPNDTFIFYALSHGLIKPAGWRPAQEVLADVETLNAWALEHRLDITKVSCHALGHVLDRYVLIRSGGALGRGCGPLIVSPRILDPAELAGLTVAIPGEYTTAAMLLRLFAPECRQTVTMRFDAIMPALAAGKVDAGVIIHESRFTYKEQGLQLVRDLGEWWEEVSGCPIPLGGIAVRRSLGPVMIGRVEAAIRESLQWAWANQPKCMGYIRQHAQEMEEGIIREHIGLYVNEFSEDLGPEGCAAVEIFLEKGREAGLLPAFADEVVFQGGPPGT